MFKFLVLENQEIIKNFAKSFGSQSIVVNIDVKEIFSINFKYIIIN